MLQETLEDIDKNRDGKISLDEYIRMYRTALIVMF